MWSYVLKCLLKNNFFTISIAGHLNICLSSESGESDHIQVFVVHIVKDCTDPWNDPKGRRRLEEFSPMGEENGGALKAEGCADWKSLRRVFLRVIVQNFATISLWIACNVICSNPSLWPSCEKFTFVLKSSARAMGNGRHVSWMSEVLICRTSSRHFSLLCPLHMCGLELGIQKIIMSIV